MKDFMVMGSYVVDTDSLRIGGVPILLFLLGVAVFAIVIVAVIIAMCTGKKKTNKQEIPLQPAAPRPAPVSPAPPIVPQPAPVSPAPPIVPQPAPVSPAPPIGLQPMTPLQNGYGYGTQPTDDDDRTVIMTGDDGTQIMAQEYVLRLTDKAKPEKLFRMPLRGTVIIGRRAGEANLVIDYDKSVSGRHCRIREADGRVFVEDMQSANGTMVDGMRIQSETEIVSGSVLTLGRVELKVEIYCE